MTRLVYALRSVSGDVTCSSSAYVDAMTRAMADAGYQVTLIAESVGRRLDQRIAVVPPVPRDAEDHYLDTFHAYSDRVHRTVRMLAPDVAELFSDEAFTAVRARRLLGRSQAPCVVRLADGDPPGPPVNIGTVMRRWAQRYVLAHADAVRPALTPWTAPHPRAVTIAESIRRVVFIGEFSPRGGLQQFAAAAQIVAGLDSSYTFEAYGNDTPTDEFGGSYLASVRRLHGDHVAFRHAPPHDGLADLFAEPAICVLPGTMGRHLAHAAMLHGVPVIRDEREGPLKDLAVLSRGTPKAFAATITALGEQPAHRLRKLTAAARDAVVALTDPDTVRAAEERLHAHVMRPVSTRLGAHRQQVSFVIPLFNQGDFVREAVDSAASCAGAEIVVVDDGSTDQRTKAVFDALTGVVKVRQPNRGLAAARNAGLKTAKGRYIIPLDADDLVEPGFLSTTLAALSAHPEAGYISCYTRNFGLFGGVTASFGNVLGLMPFLHTDARCTGLYDRRALEEVGGYDEELPAYEDWDLQIRLAKAGYEGDIVPEPLFRYRRHARSMVFTFSNDRRVELVQYLMRKHADLLTDQGIEPALLLMHLWRTRFEASESVRFLRGSR